MYKFRKIVGRNDFSDQYRKIIIRYKRTRYSMNVMRQTACLVVNPITDGNFTALFNCTPAGRASDLMMAPAYNFQLSWLGIDALSLTHRGSTVGFLLLQRFRVDLGVEYSSCSILIYMFAVLILDELKSFTRTNNLYVYESQQNLGRRLLQRETGLSPRIIYY